MRGKGELRRKGRVWRERSVGRVGGRGQERGKEYSVGEGGGSGEQVERARREVMRWLV